MYRLVEDLVLGLVAGCQWKQSISVVQSKSSEGGEKEEDFGCCSL